MPNFIIIEQLTGVKENIFFVQAATVDEAVNKVKNDAFLEPARSDWVEKPKEEYFYVDKTCLVDSNQPT
jgi:hypothetical protein